MSPCSEAAAKAALISAATASVPIKAASIYVKAVKAATAATALIIDKAALISIKTAISIKVITAAMSTTRKSSRT